MGNKSGRQGFSSQDRDSCSVHRGKGIGKASKGAKREHTSSIVPNQDPLLRSVTHRIVHAEVTRDFELAKQVLGTGYSGAVQLATSRATRDQVAIKRLRKRQLKSHRLELLRSEVEVYLRLDHPNICRLLYAYEGKHDVWLVMELCGEELYSRLSEQRIYTERDAAEVMLQMLHAIGYLHSHRIVHRDLKLENWMYGFSPPGEAKDDRLKLIDFGFSRLLVDPEETLDMPCGTLYYTSPQVLSRKYTSQCDMWSLGVIAYMTVMGKPPFRGASNLKTCKQILHSDFPRDGRWRTLSASCQDFITKLLLKDADKRMDVTTALSHPWITGSGSTPRSTEAPDIDVSVLRSFRRFAQGSHLRRAALTVLAYSLTSRELQDLEQTFHAFDRSGKGTISMEQLAEVMRERGAEVSSKEMQCIFQCADFSNDEEELHYTPFIAALLATRVQLQEEKVRAAFLAFDVDGSGYITAESLVEAFDGFSSGLSKEEAMDWIREVDYKGNGVVDYEGFFAALTGRHLWALPPVDQIGEEPTLRVWTDEKCRRIRSYSDSITDGSTAEAQKPLPQFPEGEKAYSRIRQRLASAILDGDVDLLTTHRQVQSVPAFPAPPAAKLQILWAAAEVDENYFA